MKKNILMSLLIPTALAITGTCIFGLHSTIAEKQAEASSIVLDESTDCANKDHQGYRTKDDAVAKAYGSGTISNTGSPVYTDGQYSSSRSLSVAPSSGTSFSANSAICFLNPFGTEEQLSSGTISFADVQDKYVEFMVNYDGEPIDLGVSVTDLETDKVRLTTTMTVNYGKAYISSADSSVWYYISIDLSSFSFNTDKTNANLVGGLRIQMVAEKVGTFFIDQLRMVDAPTFDTNKATPVPFDDRISMYEDDDLARRSIIKSGSYEYTELTASENLYGQSTKSLRVKATANMSAYGGAFFADIWNDGITLDKFGENTKLVGYIKGSLTNVEFISHAARFAISFYGNSHSTKVAGGKYSSLYFDHFVEADDGWYYFEFSFSTIISQIDTSTYPLDSTTAKSIRFQNGDYQVNANDYYIFDSLMIVGYQDTYDLIQSVSNADSCNSTKETVTSYRTSYLAMNGYDKNMFDNTVVTEGGVDYTLKQKLEFMLVRYGVAGLNQSSSNINVLNNNSNIVFVSLITCLIGALALIVIRKKQYSK